MFRKFIFYNSLILTRRNTHLVEYYVYGNILKSTLVIVLSSLFYSFSRIREQCLAILRREPHQFTSIKLANSVYPETIHDYVI